MDVDTPFFHHGRRRRIGILRVNSLRLVWMKNLNVVDDFTTIQINADGVERPAVLRGRSKPDLVIPDDGR